METTSNDKQTQDVLLYELMKCSKAVMGICTQKSRPSLQ